MPHGELLGRTEAVLGATMTNADCLESLTCDKCGAEQTPENPLAENVPPIAPFEVTCYPRCKEAGQR